MTTMLIYEKDNFLLDCRVDCKHNLKWQNTPRCELYISVSVMVNWRLRRVNRVIHTKEEGKGNCSSTSFSLHQWENTYYIDWGWTDLGQFLHTFIQLGYDIDQEHIHAEIRQLAQLEMQRHMIDDSDTLCSPD